MLKKIIITLFILGSFSTTTLFADYITGEIVYLNTLKESCGFKGDVMAKKHTQAEWKRFYEKGQLNEVFQGFCPKAKIVPKRYLKDLYQFLYKFAKDVPLKPVC